MASPTPIPGLDSPPPASPFRMDITPLRTQVNLFFSPAHDEDDEPPATRARAGETPQVYTRKARHVVEDDDDDDEEAPPPSKRPRTDPATNPAARLAALRRPTDAQTSALSLFDDDPPRGTQSASQMETFDPLKGPVGMMRAGDPDDEGEPSKRKRTIPKFDAERLLSERGLPALVKDAKRFRIRGKGHEAKDLGNLLSTYQMWAHQLFPKMPFSEIVARVELLCHTNVVKNALKGYRERDRELREALFRSPSPPPTAAAAAATTDPATTTRTGGVTVPDDAPTDDPGMPDDEEDYEALIAAAEAEATEAHATVPRKPATHDDEEEDYEAMIAAAEAEAAEAHAANPPPKPVEKSAPEAGDEFDDDWAAMDAMS